jgi:hypothetical protein
LTIDTSSCTNPLSKDFNVSALANSIVLNGSCWRADGKAFTWSNFNANASTYPFASVTNGFGQVFSGNGSGLTNIPPAGLQSSSGTPSSSTYYRGDGQWATPAGSGSGNASTNATQTWAAANTQTFLGPVNLYGGMNGSNAALYGATVAYAITNIPTTLQLTPSNDVVLVTNGVVYYVPTNATPGQMFTLIDPYAVTGTWTLTNRNGATIGTLPGQTGATNVFIGGQYGSGSNSVTFIIAPDGTNALRPN